MSNKPDEPHALPSNYPFGIVGHPSPFSFLCHVIYPFRWHVAGLLAGEAIWSVDMSLRPYLTKIILDRLANQGPACLLTDLLVPISAYLGLTLARECAYRCYDILYLYMMPKVKQSIIAQLMTCMMSHPHHYFQNNFAGDLANKINDIVQAVRDIIEITTDRFFSYGLGLLIASYTLYTVHPIFCILTIIWVIILSMLSLCCASYAHGLARHVAQAHGSLVGNMVDILSNMYIVRLFIAKKYEERNIQHWTEQCVTKEQTLKWFLCKVWVARGFCFVIMQFACLAFLFIGYKNRQVSLGDFALILMLNTSITDSLWYLAEDISRFCEHFGKISQGLQVLTMIENPQKKSSFRQLQVDCGEIIMKNVSLYYEQDKPQLIIPFIRINAGQKVGLVGHSGSGKTTFMHLIARIIEPHSGIISIDGQSIFDVTQESLREQCSVIPQEPFLLHRSLIENIRYGNLDSSDKEVIQAAHDACAHQFIEKLPNGYHTIIGENGTKLSGGQRQLIAIARSFLKKSPILMLDEATSALDSITEQKIQKALMNLMHSRTALIVAHRLATLAMVDRILVFDSGTIIQDGTHEELVHIPGIYQKLWNAQVGNRMSLHEIEKLWHPNVPQKE